MADINLKHAGDFESPCNGEDSNRGFPTDNRVGASMSEDASHLISSPETEKEIDGQESEEEDGEDNSYEDLNDNLEQSLVWGDAKGDTVVVATEGDNMEESNGWQDLTDGEVDRYESEEDCKEEGMFDDDVQNLYQAYQSVLAQKDEADLEPLDTSLTEEPFGDLPPISEDDELSGTGDDTGSHTEETVNFYEKSMETVIPAFALQKASHNTDSQDTANHLEMETDELLSEKIEFVNPNLQEAEAQAESTADGIYCKSPVLSDLEMHRGNAMISVLSDVHLEDGSIQNNVLEDHTNEMDCSSVPAHDNQDSSDVMLEGDAVHVSQDCTAVTIEASPEARIELSSHVIPGESGELQIHQTESFRTVMRNETLRASVRGDELIMDGDDNDKETVDSSISGPREEQQQTGPPDEDLQTVSEPHCDGEDEEIQTDNNLSNVDSPTDGAASQSAVDREEVQVDAISPSHCIKYDSGCELGNPEGGENMTVTEKDGSPSKCDDENHTEENDDTNSPSPHNYPEFVNTCEERLKAHYVSCFAKEAPVDWFCAPKKPVHRVSLKTNLIQKTSEKHEAMITFEKLEFTPGLRLLIEGRAGIGKSTLLHRIAYDYGLGLLASLQRHKLVFVLDVLKWARDQELRDAILNQVLEADAWGISPDDIFTWMENNPEEVAFFIDGLDEHPGFPAEHTLLGLAQGHLYAKSTVVFTMQPNKVFEIADCCHKVYVMQKFTPKQVLDYTEEFMEEPSDKVKGLKSTLMSDSTYLDFYSLPLHLSILCTLFRNEEINLEAPFPKTLTELFNQVFIYTLRQLVADRRVDKQKELLLSMFEDMAFVLTKLALNFLQEDVVSLTKSELLAADELDDDLLEEFLNYGLLQKITCRNAYYFPYKLFQEFLAAKYIAIEYFSASNSGQIGVEQDMKHVVELFDLCWTCYDESYRYEGICIFTSGLLNRDYNMFVDSLRKQYLAAPDEASRELCWNLVCACMNENIHNHGFVSLVVDSLATKGDPLLPFPSGDVEGCSLLGLSHVLAADKLPKLNLTNFDVSDVDVLTNIARAVGDASRLRSLNINFTDLDPTVNGAPSAEENTDDFSLLKGFVKSIVRNSSIRELGFQFDVDSMCLQAIEIISGLFLNVMSDLKSLNVHIFFDGKASYFKSQSVVRGSMHTYENLNIFIARFSVFLENNTMLEKLELNGCFLHKDALPELKSRIIKHPNLKAIHIAGQKEGAPLHREGTTALADILKSKTLEEVSIDLNSFLSGRLEKYPLTDKHVRFETSQFENELVVAKLLKSMEGNPDLKRIKFSCKQIDSDLLDHVADFIEECSSLQHLEFSCEEMDDLFMLFLGCGLVCSASIENLVLSGKFESCGATLVLIQSCLMSLSLRSVTLSGTFSLECIDWLAVSLPNLNIQANHSLSMNLRGHIVGDDPAVVEESIEQLKDCLVPLDLLLEVNFT